MAPTVDTATRAGRRAGASLPARRHARGRGTLPVAAGTVAGLGTVAGQVSPALRDFEHPGLDRVLQWDLRHALAWSPRWPGTCGTRPDRRAAVDGRAADGLGPGRAAGRPRCRGRRCTATDRRQRGLPPRRRPRTPDGIIDFGDLTSSWAVGELAVALSSVLRHAGAEPCSVLPAVRAFHDCGRCPPRRLRRCGRWSCCAPPCWWSAASSRPPSTSDNDYATGAPRARVAHLRAGHLSVPAEVMTGLIMARARPGRREPPRSARPGPVLRACSTPGRRMRRARPSAQSDAVDEGAWLEPGRGGPAGAALLLPTGTTPWPPGSARRG